MNIDFASIILQAGPLGGVVVWCLLRLEKKLDKLDSTIERFSRISVLMLVNHPATPAAVKDAANDILEEIDGPPVVSSSSARAARISKKPAIQ